MGASYFYFPSQTLFYITLRDVFNKHNAIWLFLVWVHNAYWKKKMRNSKKRSKKAQNYKII